MPTFTFTDQNGDFSCHWEWSSTYGPNADFRVLTLTIREGFHDIVQGGGGADKSPVSFNEDKKGVVKFLAEKHRKHNAVSAGDTVAKLLVLNRHGYIIRSDALVSPAVEIARGSIHQSFMVPQEHFDSIPSRKHENDDTTGNVNPLPGLRGEPLEVDACSQPQLDLLKILKNVTDSFVVCPVITSKHTSTTVVQPVLDEDLTNSPCVPPTLSSGMTHNRLVIAGTRDPTEMDTILRSAYALGIRVTIMGQREESGIPTKEHAALEGYIDILLEP
ncbi:Protein CSN12-like protein [Apiospora arundinis]